MNDKELNLDALENADEDTIKIIAADCPASDEAKNIRYIIVVTAERYIKKEPRKAII